MVRQKSKTISRNMKAYRDEVTGRWHSDLPDVFDLICEKLRNGEPFKFARYGDGEFNAIYGKQGANCDGHEYFPDMGKRLREALESKPNYIVGLQPLTLASERWPQIQKDFPDIQWVDADSIHNASIDGRLDMLFDALKEYNVHVIGPQHLARFKTNEWSFTFVPEQNCWLEYERIRSAAAYWWKEQFGPYVTLLSCGMMAEVLLHDINFLNGMTIIDMGSVLDPYVGVKSRRYHHKLAL
jgi:hypothetical protein